MQISTTILLALATIVSAAPGDRGSYTVSGLGARKQAILNAGGNTLDLAIAMLETEHMKTDYAYGKQIFSSNDSKNNKCSRSRE